MLKTCEKVLFLIVKNGIYTSYNVENVLSLVVGAVVAGIGPYFVWMMSWLGAHDHQVWASSGNWKVLPQPKSVSPRCTLVLGLVSKKIAEV